VEFDEGTLSELAAEVPELLQKARAPATNTAYGHAFAKWKAWAMNFTEVVVLPAEPMHVTLFLTSLSKSAMSFAPINTMACAITWAHAMAGLESPCHDILVKEVLNGIKRKLAKPTSRKEPFELDHINEICNSINFASLTDLRNSVLVVVAFYALLRFDEIRNLKESHVVFHTTHMELVIPKSKADQLRLGNTVVIARLGGPTCPVHLLEYYLTEASLVSASDSPDNYVFRRCLHIKSKIVLTAKCQPMSYASVRALVKSKATQLGLAAENYGTHSMRAGGATSAANSDVPDRILQRHGRWASGTSKDRYVKDSLEKRLAVSRGLGRQDDKTHQE
jgi:integrase